MGEKRGMQALELWCKRVTTGYPGVSVHNMTSSWRDGLAFCALIHHFRPDLIDFDKLSKENVYKNNALAFSVAEQQLGIPALLDPEDMVECAVPDRLSILTYLSQFYQVFGNQRSPSKVGSPQTPVALKRTTPSNEELPTTPNKVFAREVSTASSRRLEPCAVCKLPVFLAERLLVNNQLHHRTCFRCARCRHQLSLANYYETEQGAYCCETCPDEELDKPTTRPAEGEEDVLRVKAEPDAQETHKQQDETGKEEGKENEEEQQRRVAARQSVQNLIARFQTGKVAMVNPVPRPSVRSAFLQGMTDDTVEIVDTNLPSSSVEDKVEEVLEAKDILAEEKENVAEKKEILAEEKENLAEENEILAEEKEILAPEEEPSLPPTQALPTSPPEELLQEDADHLSPEKRPASPKCEDSRDGSTEEEARNPFEDDLESEIQESVTVPPSIRPEDESSNESSLDSQPEEHAPSSNPSPVTVEDKENDSVVNTEAPSSLDDVTIREKVPEQVFVPEIVGKVEDDAADISTTVNPVPKPPRRSKFFHPSELPLTEIPPVPIPRHSRAKIPEKTEIPPMTVEEYPEDLNPFDDAGEEIPLEPKKKLVPLPSTLSIPSATDFESSIPLSEEGSPKKLIPAPKISLNPFGSDDEDDEEEQNTSIVSPSAPPQRPPPPVLGTLTPRLEVTPTPTPSPKRAAPKPPADNGFNKVKSPAGTLRLKKVRPAPPPPVALAKTEKEMNNMSLQNKNEASDVISPPNKDSYGQWKRKKGPAPPRPLPQKRQLRKLPLKEIQQELHDIEIKQQGLERQGVALEKSIRSLTETEIEGGGLTLEAEDMFLQLFDLVNEKNDLLRRQAELMYLRRQQRLEEDHVELEFQIRCLMEKPESERSEQDRIREDELIQRLVAVVQKRSEIVDCLEMDRRREAEEDHSIQHHMDLYAAKNAQQPQQPASAMPKSPLMKTKTVKIKSPAKLFKKDKKKKQKEEPSAKAKSDDADKDVDETFPEAGEEVVTKEKKDSKDLKKKWLSKIV